MSAFDDIKKGRSSIYKIPRKYCHIRGENDPGRNPRENFGDIEDLARKVARYGIIDALHGSMEGTKFMVGHGERRLKAFDMAVERGWLNPRKEPDKALIPIRPEGFKPGTADRDRLIHHIILNEAKPLDLFEKGRAFERMMAEEPKMDEHQVAEELGFSITHVRDCLKLVKGAAPELQDAVASGKMAPTTAVDIVREEPDKAKQAGIVQQGAEHAAAAGSEKISAKHLPIAVGKAAQAGRRGRDPFAGKDSTPEGPVSNSHGEYTEGLEEVEIHFPGVKSTHAYVLLALVGSTYHVGWKVKWPGKTKKDGFMQVRPSIQGMTADNRITAALLALQQIRAELEVKDIKATDKEIVLETLDDKITAAASEPRPKGSGIPGGARAGASGVDNPVIRDPVKDLKEVVGAIDAKNAEKDRHKTAKKILAFLTAKEDAKTLTKYILGIE